MKRDMSKARNYRKDRGQRSKVRDIDGFIRFFLLLLAFLFAIIIFRLIYIQVVQSEELTRQALNQLTKTEVISSDRGIIYDRNNKELAINISKANVYYNMTALRQKKKERDEEFKKRKRETFKLISKELGKILNIPPQDILDKLEGDRFVRLASNIDRRQAMAIRELNIYGISVDDVIRRYYPFNNLAAHLIGFTNDENIGQYGIEASFDEELSGIPGKNVALKDNVYNRIPLTEEENFAPKDGYAVKLTMDSNIQQFAENAALKALEINEADSVSVIVQDTVSGEILAMTNKWDYDLNHPKEPINEKQKEEWYHLSGQEKSDLWFKNWRNFCINDQYEPGSTFKLITAAAALEQDTTSPNKTYTCPGVITIAPGVNLGCTSKVQGKKTMAEAVEQSCNISFIRIGQELGRENFLKYIKAFGFGKKTGIELNGEAIGQIPETAEEIGKVKLATMSYGHGIAVTPIQLINAASAIANGGYLNTPRVVKEIDDVRGNVIEKFKTETKRKVISEQTSDTMKNLMERVVLNGTGKRSHVSGYRVGGKSGTAKIPGKSGGYKEAYISSFIGVAPINDPKLTVLVIVNNPKGEILGGSIAAPVSGEILENSLNYLGIPKTEDESQEKKEMVEVPDVYGLLLEDAGKQIIHGELKFNTESSKVSDYAVVTGQNPSAGAYIEKGSIVDLAINNNDSDTMIMPNLSGKTKKEIEAVLNSMKVEYNIKGDRGFISQSPEAGQKITRKSRILIRLEDENIKSYDGN
ncbi:MAG: penicillin-binding transpeptidase domain-containing protein [Tissierellia bacterium]|nr:penicillin-binding transpeptidase domain-containing protein [Tissierellia bacterium]